MILDKQNLFSEDQAITASAASTNVIDLGALDSSVPNAMRGGMVEVLIQVTTAFTGGTSVAAALQTDDNAGFSSATVLISSAAIAVASLVAGYQFAIIRLPRKDLERYLRVYYTAVGTISAGAITAGLVMDVQNN